MRITAYKLAKLGILKGKTGKLLVDPRFVIETISEPGAFQSYLFEPTPNAPKGAHSVDMEEIEQWNLKQPTL